MQEHILLLLEQRFSNGFMGAWMSKSISVAISAHTAKDLCTWTFPTAYQFSNSYGVTTSVDVCYSYVQTKTSANCNLRAFNSATNSSYTIKYVYAVALGY